MLIDSFPLHMLHTRASSLETRKEWVRWMWPILTLVIITSFLLFRLDGKFYFLTRNFILLNLFLRGTSFQFFCFVSKNFRLIVRSASEDVIRFSFKALWDNEATFAIFSAFSLPGIPTIHYYTQEYSIHQNLIFRRSQ